jgi:hypothetical protein
VRASVSLLEKLLEKRVARRQGRGVDRRSARVSRCVAASRTYGDFRPVHLAMACRARACSARIVRPVPNAIVGHDSVTSNPVRTDHTATAAHPSTLMQKRTPITPAGGRRWRVRHRQSSPQSSRIFLVRPYRNVQRNWDVWLLSGSPRGAIVYVVFRIVVGALLEAVPSRASDTRIVVPTRNAVVRHQAVTSNPVPIAHMPTAVHPSTLIQA